VNLIIIAITTLNTLKLHRSINDCSQSFISFFA